MGGKDKQNCEERERVNREITRTLSQDYSCSAMNFSSLQSGCTHKYILM